MSIECAADLDSGKLYDIDYECRNDGHGAPERGSIEAYWTGEVDWIGKLTFRTRDGRKAYYLFLDELLEVEPV